MRCDILPHLAAVWCLKKSGHKTVKLSKEAAQILVDESKLKWSDLKR